MNNYFGNNPAGGFIPVDAVIPGYSANQQAIAQAQASAYATALTKAAADRKLAVDKRREAIGSQIDAEATTDLSRRNEATAARQNQNAMLNREGTRAGGGRYRRRGLFSPGGSGLDKANASAMIEGRKKAAYANLDATEAARTENENRAAQVAADQANAAAMNAYNNRFIGFKNGALYV